MPVIRLMAYAHIPNLRCRSSSQPPARLSLRLSRLGISFSQYLLESPCDQFAPQRHDAACRINGLRTGLGALKSAVASPHSMLAVRQSQQMLNLHGVIGLFS